MEKNRTYSKIIAGTMTWGSWGKQLSSKEMIDLMHHCLSLGIYTFDHADIYDSLDELSKKINDLIEQLENQLIKSITGYEFYLKAYHNVFKD